MIFESQDNIYEVIRLVERKETYDTYLCRSGKKEYLIFQGKDESLQRSCCRLFLETIQQNKCDGLCEIFSGGDSFFFVFVYHPLDFSLSDCFAHMQEMSFSKKMDFLKRMLSALCVLEIPVSIACDLFLHGNIGIASDGTEQACYKLKELEYYENFGMNHFAVIFADCMDKLFAGEMKKKQFQELADYRKKLEESSPEDFVEFYESFCQMQKNLEEKLAASKYREGILPAKGIEKLKMILNVVKKILILLILLAAVGVLLWSLRGESSKKGGIYSSIGDVTIQEYQEESQR
jgi:hypothetical protein